MRLRPKQALAALVLAILTAFAYAQALSAGPLGEDVALARGASLTTGPLTRASLALTASLYGGGDSAGAARFALGFRLENLALLLCAGVALGLFTRRLLLPWMGVESALGAARAATVFLVLHPLAVLSTTHFDARGDLLALALGLSAAALFLRGRQDRRLGAALAAFLCALLAALADESAYGLPLLLFLAELTSAHRYRPLAVRLRTALTTAMGVTVVVTAQPLFELARSLPVHRPELVGVVLRLAEPGEVAAAFGRAMGKLGLLLLPVNPAAVGVLGTALAGVLVLVALQPALVAARSAPRLWGWVGALWVLALLASSLLHLDAPVERPGPVDPRALLPSVAMLTLGLGITSTALRGPRRPWVAWAVAVLLSVLAHGALLPLGRASSAYGELAGHLEDVVEAGAAGRLLVLDPPAVDAGFDPLGRALETLPDPSGPGLEVRALSSAAFLCLVREPELTAWAEQGLWVSCERDALVLEHGNDARSETRLVRRVLPQGPSTGARSWQGTLSSPPLDLSPLAEEAVRVRVPANGAEALGGLSWETDPVGPAPPPVEPLWRPAGDEAEGLFDLGDSLAWRCAGRVRTLLFPRGTQSIRSAVVEAALPPVLPEGARPRVEGTLWTFPRPAAEAPWEEFAGTEVAQGAAALRLSVLRLADLAFERVELRVDGDRLVGSLDRLTPDSSHPRDLAWMLEARVHDHAVARSRGRL